MRSTRSNVVRWDDYSELRRIDGRHPFRRAVPGGYVLYRARRRHGGEVAYFNFSLAKEIGLLPHRHPDRLNPRLSRAILDAFCLVIINEYDMQRKTQIPPRDVLPNRYMATRYLQLQHGDRCGRTSGDGRSIWNGTFTSHGITWDISSRGTGVTRLCPATAARKRFYKTGSRRASYGCGTSSLEEGLSSALLSEAFHRNGVATERMLAVIALPNGLAINIRAARNLLRPSHFFLYSRQSDLVSLRAAIGCFIDRQVANGVFPRIEDEARRYAFLSQDMARVFARAAATFESEYIFCWLDWDGDNILADGGIIDYGSVRQFGLYHREYRYDDGPRMSTTIPEQRRKARAIVQNFAQIRDFLITHEKTPLRSYAGDPILTLFDEEFERTKHRLLLRNIGFPDLVQAKLLGNALPLVRRFRRAHAYFEHARSTRGPRKVGDGLTWNAIFSTRDLLRELPERYLLKYEFVSAPEFMEIALSSYASRRDRVLTPHRKRMALAFQRTYLELMRKGAVHAGCRVAELLEEVLRRSAIINRYARITGDSVTHAARSLVRNRKRLSSDQLHRVVNLFVRQQVLIPECSAETDPWATNSPDAKQVLDGLVRLVGDCRHGL